MENWNARINENDRFHVVYASFFDLYHDGHDPKIISKAIQKEFAKMFDDVEDRNPAIFALALAQWETTSLDVEIFDQVKRIIETGQDLKIWRASNADSKFLEKREKELAKFLKRIAAERKNAKRRHRPKLKSENVSLLSSISPDNLKRFDITEHYINNEYINTCGTIMWTLGGASVLYFTGRGRRLSAKWIDGQTLEIIHEKSIIFEKRDIRTYFRGDEVSVIYTMID